MAVICPFVSPLDPVSMNARSPVQSPSWGHPLGTDSFGRDLLARVIWGARISLAIAAGTIVLGGVIGTAIGLVAGYVGGVVDSALMRLMDAIFTFPSILLAVALMGALGSGQTNVVIALGVVYIPGFARQTRAETRMVMRREYVHAAMAAGVPAARLLVRHVLPNISGSLVVRAATFLAF
jgi:peptide/nickel transport system permease protein